MAHHSKSEVLHTDEETGRRWCYETSKVNRTLRTEIREEYREGGFWFWPLFGGWSFLLARTDSPATARKVEGMHAAHRLAALAAVHERAQVVRAALAARNEARSIVADALAGELVK